MKRRGVSVLRLAGVLGASAAGVLVASFGLAWVVMSHGRGIGDVAQAVQTVRPWLIPIRLSLLVLLWVHWARLIDFFTRRRHLSEATRQALVAQRSSVFIMLGLVELILVSRVLASMTY